MDSFGTQRETLGNCKIVIDQARAIILVAPGVTNSPDWRHTFRAVKFRFNCVKEAAEAREIKRGVRISIVLSQWSGSDEVGPVVELVESAEVGRVIDYRK